MQRSLVFVYLSYIFIIFPLVVQSTTCGNYTCINGGTCTLGTSGHLGPSCICPVGYVGPSCSVASLSPLTCFNSNGDIIKSTNNNNNLYNSLFCFEYGYTESIIHFSLYSTLQGYLSIMFYPGGDGMSNGIDWVGIFCDGSDPSSSLISSITSSCRPCNKGKGPTGTDNTTSCYNPWVIEEYSPSISTPVSLSTNQNLLIASSGLATSTLTHVQYSRYLTPMTTTTGSQTRIVIDDTMINAAWAIGTNMIYSKHVYAGLFRLNLKTGEASPANQVNYWNFYTPSIVFMGILISVGLILFPSFCENQLYLCRLLVLYRPFSFCLTRIKALFDQNPKKNDDLPTNPSKFRNIYNLCSQALLTFTLSLIRTISSLYLIELLFILLFIVYFIILIVLGLATFTQANFNDAYAYTMGHVTGVAMSLAVLPVTHNSVLALLFKSSFERLLKFHRWVGRISFICIWIHFIGMYRLYPTRLLEAEPLPYGDSVLAGTISLIFINVLVLSSLNIIRRYAFELFYYIHLLTFIGCYTSGLIHSLHFRYYSIIPIILYLLDRIIRYYRSNIQGLVFCNQLKVHISPDTSTVTELDLVLSDNNDKLRSFEPGSYVFINIPDISTWQWHPISISSYPLTNNTDTDNKDTSTNTNNNKSSIRLHIAACGEWSTQLAELSKRLQMTKEFNHNDQESKYLLVKIDGPYGSLQHRPNHYKSIILCGAGIGVTPMISIAMYLYNQIYIKKNKDYLHIESIHLIFVSKQTHHLEQWFTHDLNILRLSSDRFRIHLFASNKGDTLKLYNNVLRHRSTFLVNNNNVANTNIMKNNNQVTNPSKLLTNTLSLPTKNNGRTPSIVDLIGGTRPLPKILLDQAITMDNNIKRNSQNLLSTPTNVNSNNNNNNNNKSFVPPLPVLQIPISNNNARRSHSVKLNIGTETEENKVNEIAKVPRKGSLASQIVLNMDNNNDTADTPNNTNDPEIVPNSDTNSNATTKANEQEKNNNEGAHFKYDQEVELTDPVKDKKEDPTDTKLNIVTPPLAVNNTTISIDIEKGIKGKDNNNELDDWKLYENEVDQYTEYGINNDNNQVNRYWFNAKTGQTSLVPPEQFINNNDEQEDDNNNIPVTPSANKKVDISNKGTENKNELAPPAKNKRLQVSMHFTHEMLLTQQILLPDTAIQFGRPDFIKLFGELKRENPPFGPSNPSSIVYMCGPELFMDSVESAADRFGFAIHKETFYM